MVPNEETVSHDEQERGSTFTPGPWKLNDGRWWLTMVETEGGNPICRMTGDSVYADALLIVAVHDLLAVARDFVAMYDGLDDVLGDTVKAKVLRARAAIAKALGGAR